MNNDWLEFIGEELGNHFIIDTPMNENIYDSTMNQYLKRFNLKESMEVINKVEGNPIPEGKIANADIRKNEVNGKLKHYEANRMMNVNNSLDYIRSDNPFYLDYIIL